jgi:hypothetical protein
MAEDSANNPRAALEQVNAGTLPKIYREIGRRVAKSPKVPAALKHHFDAIARLKPAADAQDAAAIAELREVYAALGQEAVERYGDKAVPKDLATLLADTLAKQRARPEAFVQPPHAKPRSRKRRSPVIAYAAVAAAIAAACGVGVVLWPKAPRSTARAKDAAATAAAPGNSAESIKSTTEKAPTTATPRRASASKNPATTNKAATPEITRPDFDALIVSFSAEDADRLKSLESSSGDKPKQPRARSRDEEAAALSRPIIDETKAAIERLSAIRSIDDMRNAMAAIVQDWTKAIAPLADPMEEEPALREILRVGSNKVLMQKSLASATQTVDDRHQRSLNTMTRALEDAQKFAVLAFGGEDDNGRPLKRPEPERQQMLAGALGRFAAACDEATVTMARCRVSELRDLLSAYEQKSDRRGRCVAALRMDIDRAEKQWRSTVSGVQDSLEQLIADGKQFTDSDSLADFARMANEQQARLGDAVASASRELASFWSGIAADMVTAIADAKDLDDLDNRRGALSSRVEARLNESRKALDKAHDDVQGVFANRMDEAQRRIGNATTASRDTTSADGHTTPARSTAGNVIPRRFFQQRIVVGMPMEDVRSLLGPPDSESGEGSPVVVWEYHRVKDENTGRGCAMVTISRPTGRVVAVDSIPINRDEVRRRR